jgi:hypothetical protein
MDQAKASAQADTIKLSGADKVATEQQGPAQQPNWQTRQPHPRHPGWRKNRKSLLASSSKPPGDVGNV